MVSSGILSLVNSSWNKQKKKAILIFDESKVNIAAMFKNKRVSGYTEINVHKSGPISRGIWCLPGKTRAKDSSF